YNAGAVHVAQPRPAAARRHPRSRLPRHPAHPHAGDPPRPRHTRVVCRPRPTALIPPPLANHDLIACAETGTGKTAAFVVPTLQWLLTTGARDAKPAVESPPGRAARAAPPQSRGRVLEW